MKPTTGKSKYNVWFFGSEAHFTNSLGRDFGSLRKAVRYIKKTMSELEYVYNELFGNDGGELTDEDREKFLVGEETNEMIWMRDTADDIRIVKDDNPGHIVASWRATYNGDGEFEGWVGGLEHHRAGGSSHWDTGTRR